jgi:hypothetical protein
VIWRDDNGHPVHTGVVKALGSDFVLVESKWGFGGRFLHQLEDQGYSKHFDYYRSPRAGHVLHFEAPDYSSPGAASPGILATRPASSEPAGEVLDPRVLGAE